MKTFRQFITEAKETDDLTKKMKNHTLPKGRYKIMLHNDRITDDYWFGDKWDFVSTEYVTKVISYIDDKRIIFHGNKK